MDKRDVDKVKQIGCVMLRNILSLVKIKDGKEDMDIDRIINMRDGG